MFINILVAIFDTTHTASEYPLQVCISVSKLGHILVRGGKGGVGVGL